MFAHVFCARLKCLLRSKQMMFWTLLFPLLLATFFQMAFSNLVKAEDFDPVPVAVVDDAAYQADAAFQTALKSVSEGDNRIFDLTVASKEDAESMLKDGTIDGYLTDGNGIQATFKDSSLNQSIIKSFADSYLQISSATTSIFSQNPAAAGKLADDLKQNAEYTKEVSGGTANPDSSLLEFYTLVAMMCLYGAFFGLNEVNNIQADLSDRAARLNVAPVHKLKTFLAGLSAAFLIHFAEILALLAYLAYGFGIDFGKNAGLVVLTSFVGSIVGVSFGAFMGAAVKKSESMKISTMIGVIMLGCFLAGMMGVGMKYTVAQVAPAVSWLNPANLLTDAFYTLYYYSTYSRFTLDIAALGIFALLFCGTTYFIIRRQKYASL